MLKRARLRRKLTQAQLADKVGVHKITVSRLERGDRQPSMSLLQRLAKALGVPVTELLG
jgi:transcriptional regulator with XRE-family HTH domain